MPENVLPQQEPKGNSFSEVRKVEGRGYYFTQCLLWSVDQAPKQEEENTPEAVIAHSNISTVVSFIFKNTQIEPQILVSGNSYWSRQRQ